MGIGQPGQRPDRGGPAGRAVRQERRSARAPTTSSAPALTGARPHVQAFIDWLVAEAQGRVWPQRRRARAQLPTTSGAVSRRRAASTLSAVMRPVRGFSSEGMFSIVMVRSEESDLTMMVCVLRVTRRVGPHLDLRAVGADAGERQRHRHVDVGRESRRWPRARCPRTPRSGAFSPSTEMPRSHQQRRAGEARRRLARDDAWRRRCCLRRRRARRRGPSSAPVGTMMRAPVSRAQLDEVHVIDAARRPTAA